MVKKNYIIDINGDIEWWIYRSDFKFKEQDRYIFGGNVEYGFAKAGCDKNGDIVYLFDIAVRDEDIKKAENDDRFLQNVTFCHKNRCFQGTFIDALKYIKEIFYGRDR